MFGKPLYPAQFAAPECPLCMAEAIQMLQAYTKSIWLSTDAAVVTLNSRCPLIYKLPVYGLPALCPPRPLCTTVCCLSGTSTGNATQAQACRASSRQTTTLLKPMEPCG